ncbi:MAG: SDR family oxidoreductase [Bacteroidota bacterium]|nr:SDR family oxidoreductase [Candidatus Kapabacteria bacterium]MCS7302161.1 SDR family oxidoreductase [Candidatus Kapabacteria bacterium]MCX7936410.1 SDR family oxidoreductase [Chlorobiota bacterium]MDW8074310.1 SDR family oxidoreductase [Bacteroidota bacterium]MDW8271214.1 SDR family oxidoreductase [Bacteroidota bacterium]
MDKQQCYALILGASSGFGRATALALAAEGYPIIGVHLDRAAALPAVEELKSKIQSYGVRTLFFNANAADAARRAEIIAALKDEFRHVPGSGVYLMLHSLAFGTLRPLVSSNREEAITQSQLEMTLDVMANSLVYWVQDLYAEGLLLRGGRILSLTSAGSHRNLPMYGAVSAAKAALESYTRQLALELASMEITVNAIRAGVTDTPALRKIPGNERLIANAIMRNPNHRLTTPEDVARIIVLLARPEAQWINAHVLGADGGEDAIDITWWDDAVVR